MVFSTQVDSLFFHVVHVVSRESVVVSGYLRFFVHYSLYDQSSELMGAA